MRNHDNNKGGGHNRMMWMMISFLLLLLLLGVLFLGGDKVSSVSDSSAGGYFWPMLVSVFVVAHIWMMFRGYERHVDDAEDVSDAGMKKQPEGKDEQKHDG